MCVGVTRLCEHGALTLGGLDGFQRVEQLRVLSWRELDLVHRKNALHRINAVLDGSLAREGIGAVDRNILRERDSLADRIAELDFYSLRRSRCRRNDERESALQKRGRSVERPVGDTQNSGERRNRELFAALTFKNSLVDAEKKFY